MEVIQLSDSTEDDEPKDSIDGVTFAKMTSDCYKDGAHYQYYFREISVEDKQAMFTKIQNYGKSISSVAAEHGVLMNNLRFWYLDWINQKIVKPTKVKERRASDTLTHAYNQLVTEEKYDVIETTFS